MQEEQGREAESLCVSHKACVVNTSCAGGEGEGGKREGQCELDLQSLRESLRPRWSAPTGPFQGQRHPWKPFLCAVLSSSTT